MAIFRVTINTGNAAFEDNGPGSEVAEILRDLAHRCETAGLMDFPLLDTNGNRVGDTVLTA